MAIDTHTHVNGILVPKYLASVQDTIDSINNDNFISSVINVGLNIETSRESVEIASKNEKFYSSIGIHPLYVRGEETKDLSNLVTTKVVAIGEIGLDKSDNNFIEQRRYLIEQIKLANILCLPVIIHSSNSNREVIRVFEEVEKPQYGCVFHCFQPDLDDLAYLVKNGYYVSFAGRITYKTAKKSIEVLNAVPKHLFLIETDSPYISPEPVRDSVNCSHNIYYIIERIASILGVPPEEVMAQADENAKKLFKIKR